MKTDDGVLNFGTKLSSAGLVYKHYGREVLGKLAAALSPPTQEFTPLEPDHEDILFRKMYQHFVEHIDGIDNGVEMAEGPFNYSITRSPILTLTLTPTVLVLVVLFLASATYVLYNIVWGIMHSIVYYVYMCACVCIWNMYIESFTCMP
jgi:hypothetical protein